MLCSSDMLGSTFQRNVAFVAFSQYSSRRAAPPGRRSSGDGPVTFLRRDLETGGSFSEARIRKPALKSFMPKSEPE